MDKKYELTDETIEWYGRTLYRIRAVKDFCDVKKGELGGFVESEDNLSHDGDCWIYANAKVYDDAFVCNNAFVRNNARASGNAEVRDNAEVSGYAIVFDNAQVRGRAIVCNSARICDKAIVCDNAEVRNNAKVCNNAEVCDNAVVGGNPYIKENAYITSNSDFLCIGQIGSRNDYTTFYLDKDKNIHVSCGCFNGTIDKFEKAVEKTHGDNEYGKQYEIAIETAAKMLSLWKPN